MPETLAGQMRLMAGWKNKPAKMYASIDSLKRLGRLALISGRERRPLLNRIAFISSNVFRMITRRYLSQTR